MKHKILLLLIILSFFTLLSMGTFPNKGLTSNVGKVTALLKEKNYTVEVGRRFHIGLKRNESVKYVVTAPVYLSKTAIGIATDENVKKLKIVIYSQLNKEAEEISIFGDEIESSTYIKEIEEKSYHYTVEISLLESELSNEYAAVDMLVAFAPMPLKTEEEVKKFYYNHVGEREYYNNPIRSKKDLKRKSDTGKIPCNTLEYGQNCNR